MLSRYDDEGPGCALARLAEAAARTAVVWAMVAAAIGVAAWKARGKLWADSRFWWAVDAALAALVLALLLAAPGCPVWPDAAPAFLSPFPP